MLYIFKNLFIIEPFIDCSLRILSIVYNEAAIEVHSRACMPESYQKFSFWSVFDLYPIFLNSLTNQINKVIF